MKKIYGEYMGKFLVPDARIYIGMEDDGTEFAQMSFMSMGQMHSDFDSIKLLNDDEAIFVIVTSGTSMDVVCKLVNDKLNVHIDINKDMSIDYELEKISSTAVYEKEYFVIPEQNIAALKRNNKYQKDNVIVEYEYELYNENVLKFLDERGFERVKDKSFNSIWKLYIRLCELYTQNGLNYVHSKDLGTIAQIKQAELHDGFTNCRGISVIFSGVLRANGIKAFYEGLFPLNVDDSECHIVNEVYVEDFNKYVLFDASLCAVYKLDGNYLNSIEIKNAIIDGRAGEIEIERCCNKKKSNSLETLSYYSKNIGHLVRCINNSESTDTTEDNQIVLSPVSVKDTYKKNGLVTTDINKYYM